MDLEHGFCYIYRSSLKISFTYKKWHVSNHKMSLNVGLSFAMAKDEHINAVFPRTWRPPLFVCVSPVFRNIYFVELLGVVKSLVNLQDHFITRVILAFIGKKHFTFLEVKWTGFRVHDFSVVWGSIFSGGTRRGEGMIQVLVFIMGILESCYIWNCVDFNCTGDGQDGKWRTPMFFHMIRECKVLYLFICTETFLYDTQCYMGFYSHHILFLYVPLD